MMDEDDLILLNKHENEFNIASNKLLSVFDIPVELKRKKNKIST